MPLAKQDIPAALLVGGMGTRLRAVVPNAPKPLATVGDKSFLDFLVRQLHSQGIRRLVMCTGYMADQIENYFGVGEKWDVSIVYSRELQPLGTAGAIKLAGPNLQGASEFIVMNGDSFMEVDLDRLLEFHRKSHAIASLAARRVDNAARYGTLQLAGNGRVSAFLEKTGEESPGLVNAGVYIFNHELLEKIPDGPCSLEKDVFPGLLGRGIYALEQQGVFIDIGTPEDYARAQGICDRLDQAASLKQ